MGVREGCNGSMMVMLVFWIYYSFTVNFVCYYGLWAAL